MRRSGVHTAASLGGIQLNVCAAPGSRDDLPRGRFLAHLIFGCALGISFLTAARPAHAELIVPAGAVFDLAIFGGGTLDLACTDVVVAGTLLLSTGSISNARNVTIQAGGTIDGGSGAVEMGGDWANSGQFNAGTSVVSFRDLCSLTAATITGNTTFATASFVTATGKSYVFAAGATQTVNNLLQIVGSGAPPIWFQSQTPGQVGFINLLPAGTQLIQHVRVNDVWATGQWLAPLLTNAPGGANANRWFGGSASVVAPIPTLADATLLALAALIAATGTLFLRRRRSNIPDLDRPRQ